MLFASEQITPDTESVELSEATYTISGQVADYAFFTISGGDIAVRYDGISLNESGIVQVLDKDAVLPYKLESREQIEGMRFFANSGVPVIDIQYISLEWADLRRVTIPKLKMNSVRRAKTNTQKIDMSSANFQLRRLSNRPLHQFGFNSLWQKGDFGGETVDMHGFFYVHQGDTPFFLFANKFSIVETPTLVGYGDGSTEDFFLPARFIRPFSDVVFLNGLEVDSYSLDHASGLISFITAPRKGTLIMATFAHYYKCVFMDDTLQDTLVDHNNVLLDRNYRLMEVRP